MKNITITVDGLSESQRGYLAGFLDGEGGIQITRSRRANREYKVALHPTVYFCNTYRRAIYEMKNWLGGGSITRRREPGNHKDSFVYSISGVRSVRALLTFLLPAMIIKKHQARVMISYCDSRLQHYRGNDRRFTRKELRLYTRLKGLNKKGGGAKKRQRTVV